MEKYCITIEQAKRLGDLGAFVKFGDLFSKQFYWYEFNGNSWLEDMKDFVDGFVPEDDEASCWYPAYHVGELGEILGNWCENVQYEQPNVWNLFFSRIEDIIEYRTEAQARGALLIHLLENNLL